MTLTGIPLIFLAAVLSALSNLLLRQGVTAGGGFGVSGNSLWADVLALARQPTFLCGLLFYCLAALVWFRVMSTGNLSQSYVILVGLTFLFVLAGSTMFGEIISMRKIIGALVILCGIHIVSSA